MAASGEWAMTQSHKIGPELGEFDGKEKVLDRSVHKGVQAALNALSAGRETCAEGVCIVFSENQQMYFLLWRSDVKPQVYQRYGFVDPGPPVPEDPVPATEPDQVPATEPDPVPETEPDPVPAQEPEPVPAPVPDPAPVVEPPIDGGATTATITGNVSKSGVTYFQVSVTFQNGMSWVVEKRYNEFKHLKDQLPPSAAEGFPKKTWGACAGAELVARQSALQEWLRVQVPQKDFSELEDHWVALLGRPIQRSFHD